jgi:large subunit ribosomal protein L24
MVRVHSVKPSKQRKSIYQAAAHMKRSLLSAHLSEDLRKKHGARSFPVRLGDTVKIMRGDFSGIEGKVSEIDRKEVKLFIDGVTREKTSGETVKAPVRPSKVMIMNLNLDDKWRKRSLDKRKTKS